MPIIGELVFLGPKKRFLRLISIYHIKKRKNEFNHQNIIDHSLQTHSLPQRG
jgi:hypothetical protein